MPDLSGSFGIGLGLELGILTGQNVDNQIKRFVGQCYLKSLAPIDKMLTVGITNYIDWSDLSLFIDGQGSGSTFAMTGRTCNVGLYNGGVGRGNFGRLRFRNFRYAGYLSNPAIPQNGNTFTRVDANGCGSGRGDATSYSGNWSNPVNSGTASGISQRTTVTVDMPLPSWLASYATPGTTNFLGFRNGATGRLHQITSADVGASTLTIAPWITSGATSGTFYLSFGGAVNFIGVDTNINTIEMLYTSQCGLGLNDQAAYGTVVNLFQGNTNGTDYLFSRPFDSAYNGGRINSFYTEGGLSNDQVVQAGLPGSINHGGVYGAQGGPNFNKWYVLSAPVDAFGRVAGGFGAMAHMQTDLNGIPYNFEKDGANLHFSDPSLSLNVAAGFRRLVEAGINSTTIALSVNSSLNRMFGFDNAEVVLMGNNSDGSPSGTVTFTAPSGQTVNGAGSVAFTRFRGPARFRLYWRVADANILVFREDGVMFGTVSYNPPSLAAGALDSVQTATVNGAVLGMIVEASFSINLAGARLEAWVSAANTVSYRFSNPTGSAIDLAAGTVLLSVRRV